MFINRLTRWRPLLSNFGSFLPFSFMKWCAKSIVVECWLGEDERPKWNACEIEDFVCLFVCTESSQYGSRLSNSFCSGGCIWSLRSILPDCLASIIISTPFPFGFSHFKLYWVCFPTKRKTNIYIYFFFLKQLTGMFWHFWYRQWPQKDYIKELVWMVHVAYKAIYVCVLCFPSSLGSIQSTRLFIQTPVRGRRIWLVNETLWPMEPKQGPVLLGTK